MEKKKLVKPIVIAASVAAVVGISAVSFAAWSGSSTDVDVTGGATGTLTLASLTSTTTSLDNLLPYDQPGTPATGSTEMWTIDLVVAGDDIAAYNIEGYATTSIEGTLYYQISTTTVTQPTTDLTGWTALPVGSTNQAALNTSALAAGTYNVYIVLDSNDYAKDGAGKTIDLHFELAEA